MDLFFTAGVGKTSLILSLVSEEFAEEVCFRDQGVHALRG